MFDFPNENLRQWFLRQKRDLPWRKNSSPYAVLVSEIMLQQTQVSVVIPYFQRWMALFPTFEALAISREEDVLKAWEGLGYYSRAKNLQKAAKYICKEWKGKMPSKVEELATIPGVGPYTLGAIRAFAFNEKAAAVDGNVMRVLSRYFAIEEDISKLRGQKRFRDIAEKILPEKDPWIIAEALIELGALVCKKRPICIECPLKSSCSSFNQDLIEKFPVKSKLQVSIKLYRMVPILMCEGTFLIRQVPKGKIMAGLHEFPYFEEKMDLAEFQEQIKRDFNLETTPIRKLPLVQHGFTRYRADLEAYIFHCKNVQDTEGFFWASKERLSQLAFSSGHRKLIKLLF